MGDPHQIGPARPSPVARVADEPGAAAARPSAVAAPPSAAPRPRPEPRPRPDPNPLRLMVGFVGLASLSAIATGLLPSVVPAYAAIPGAATIVADAAPLAAKHVTRYVQLKPGQTAPPQAAVVAAPTPTPRVVVVTTTRQSGKP